MKTTEIQRYIECHTRIRYAECDELVMMYPHRECHFVTNKFESVIMSDHKLPMWVNGEERLIDKILTKVNDP